MTKGEFLELYAHLDDDTEIMAASAYDYEETGELFPIEDGIGEDDFYHDDDCNRPVIVLFFNNEED